MAEKKKYNSILISGRKDQTLTYSRYVKDEESGESVKESLDKKVNTTDKLESQQIKDGAITNEKLAADSVGNTNMQDGSVSNEKLEDGSITNEKLAENSITKDKLKDNTIGVEKLDPELRQAINAATGLPEDLVENIQNVDDTLKDHQSQLNDKQQQITANDEDISLLQTRSTQIEETIKSIAATGGASQATAVTYNNENSQLAAINIQSAVDELQGSKIDKTSISQESGESEDKVMSQKAVSTKLSDLFNQANKSNDSIQSILMNMVLGSFAVKVLNSSPIFYGIGETGTVITEEKDSNNNIIGVKIQCKENQVVAAISSLFTIDGLNHSYAFVDSDNKVLLVLDTNSNGKIAIAPPKAAFFVFNFHKKYPYRVGICNSCIDIYTELHKKYVSQVLGTSTDNFISQNAIKSIFNTLLGVEKNELDRAAIINNGQKVSFSTINNCRCFIMDCTNISKLYVSAFNPFNETTLHTYAFVDADYNVMTSYDDSGEVSVPSGASMLIVNYHKRYDLIVIPFHGIDFSKEVGQLINALSKEKEVDVYDIVQSGFAKFELHKPVTIATESNSAHAVIPIDKSYISLIASCYVVSGYELLAFLDKDDNVLDINSSSQNIANKSINIPSGAKKVVINFHSNKSAYPCRLIFNIISSEASTANAVPYDNKTSGIKATNMQEAIDELVAKNKAEQVRINTELVLKSNPTSYGYTRLGVLDLQYPEFDYNILINYGQSLSAGGGLLSNGTKTDIYMLGQTPHVSNNITDDEVSRLTLNKIDLSASTTQNVGITAGVSALSNFQKVFSRNNKQSSFILIDGGQGSYSAAQLMDFSRYGANGTKTDVFNFPNLKSPNSREPYSRLVSLLKRVKDIAKEEGKTIGVFAVLWIQGEADMGYETRGTADTNTEACLCNGDGSEWKKRVLQLRKDLNEDIGTIFSQSSSPYWFVSQCGGKFLTNKYFEINQAQIDLCDNKTMFMLEPSYWVTHNNDGHPTGDGYRTFGECISKKLCDVIIDNSEPHILRPREIYSLDDSHIRIYYSVPTPPITINTSYVQAFKNYGFVITDKDTNVRDIIESVKVCCDYIDISLNSPLKDGDSIEYGTYRLWTPSFQKFGRGNICDSSKELSYYPCGLVENSDVEFIPTDTLGNNYIGKKIYLPNFCISFKITYKK